MMPAASPMQSTLMIEARSVYGNVLYYPACEQSKRLAAMLGTKTLTINTIRQAQAMGFTVRAIGWEIEQLHTTASYFTAPRAGTVGGW